MAASEPLSSGGPPRADRRNSCARRPVVSYIGLEQRQMRHLHAQNLRVATRGTTREINRRIALNLVRTHQPISRADLARLMGTRRGAVSLLVNELIRDRAVFEGATGEAKRGRKPTFLYIDSRKRCVVAVDIRPTRTFVMVTDLVGRQLASVTSFPTERDPKRFVAGLVKRVKGLLAEHKDLGICQGVGVVVPGVVESETGLVLLAPNLGWRNLRLRDPIAAALGVPVQIENSGKACALAQLWAAGDAKAPSNFVYITVSDGLGVGIVLGGEVVRGQHNVAGEFGHVPLNIDGPRCGCGATGCWEAYVSNLATLSRYFGRDLRERPVRSDVASLTVDDLIVRARGGDGKALAALLSTARYLGLGLGSVVNAIDPSHVYIGGEITAAWDLIEATVRAGLAERALTSSAGATPIIIVPPEQYPRLRGAAALIAAASFAQ
jgi:N-acetylglucosamine repressor